MRATKWSIGAAIGAMAFALLPVSAGAGTPTPPAMPTPVPFAVVAALDANSLVYEPHSGVVFASVGGQSPKHPNSVVPIYPTTGAIGAPVLFGTEPNPMAVSDDGKYLYVGLDGERKVARVNLATGAEDLRWSLGRELPPQGFPPEWGAELVAADIAVMPGHPDVVAVASSRTTTEFPGDLVVYDDGVARPSRVSHAYASDAIAYDIEFSDVVPGRLYGRHFTTHFRLDVTDTGVALVDQFPLMQQYGPKFAVTGGRIVDGLNVIDPEAETVVAVADSRVWEGSTSVEVDAAAGQFYVARSTVEGHVDVAAFSATSGLPTDKYTAKVDAGSPVIVGTSELIGPGRLAVAVPPGPSTAPAVLLIDIGARRGAAGEYTPVTPSRIVDTRLGIGVGSPSPLGAGATMDVQVTGRGGVPGDGVSAVVVNVTAVDATDTSYLTVWPGGTAPPEISSLNYGPGGTRANLVSVAVGAGGTLSVFNERGTVGVVMDIVGYYATPDGVPASRFRALAPARAFDTRSGLPLASNTAMSFRITGMGGVPLTGITAVALNVTAVDPTGPGYVTVWPADVARPTASNLNFGAGQNVPNLVIVRVPPSGDISFYNFGGDTHLVADVAGYYTSDRSTEGGRFVQLGPKRLFDTRQLKNSSGFARGLWPGDVRGPGHPFDDSGYGAYVLNVTATGTSGAGYVTVFPSPGAPPLASNVNYGSGETVPNAVIVASGAGAFSFANEGGRTQLIADLFGAFTATDAGSERAAR
jgi:hypothetical protein